MTYCVYMHVNKINNKKYVGITKQDPILRWGLNGQNYKNEHLQSAIKKYGWNNFDHIIIQDNLTKEEACKKERQLIKELNLQDSAFGYNILEGGTAPSLTPEVRAKISVKLIGNKNGMGHVCSEAKKEKIRQAQLGNKFTEEHKQKLSNAAKKRHVKCSEEKKQILSEHYPHKKKVYCVELDTVYDSVQECGRQLGIKATNITKVCRGHRNTLKGFHFKYYDI